jgi:hypothetical protein
MLSIKTFFLLIAFLASTSAFAPPSFSSHSGGVTTALSLHPSQAKELEACAYDILKKQNQEKVNVARGAAMGPVGWCVRLFAPKTASGAPRQGR